MANKTKWLLGNLKGRNTPVYLEDFSWDCGWYWGGGYVSTYDMHCHFDGCFLEVPDLRGHPLGNFVTPWTKLDDYNKHNPKVIENGAAVWADLGFFLNNPQYTPAEWWRIKDLFKQFYTLRNAAEVFQHGGHCSGQWRKPAELNKEMADKLNAHIRDVIIPEIHNALNHVDLKADQEKERARVAPLCAGENI